MADINGGMGMFGEDASGVFFEDGLVADLVWAEFVEPASGPITHTATGALQGQGAIISGASARVAGTVTHTTTGALTGQGSSIAATSLRYRQFSSTGALIGPASSLAGVSARAGGPVTHGTSGTL